MARLWTSYKMRVRRRRLRYRARIKGRRDLTSSVNRTSQIKKGDLLLFCTAYNEMLRLPWFLKYHRSIGVKHFLFVDNGSTDGTHEYLREQPDVSVWHTKASYKKSRFGMDWMNFLLSRYGHNHWCLTLDPDELFVYPFCDTRPVPALTDWLDASSVRSFGTMLLDMYPKGPVGAQPYQPGDDPIETIPWFDSGNYSIRKNKQLGDLWIQGGPRARAFFADIPKKAPALNKVPLVYWKRHYTYLSSTHNLLPRGLNLVYDEWGGEKASGVLLHTKFLQSFELKAEEELTRRQHYANSAEYKAYSEHGGTLDLWCNWSERFINWRQLEILGILSKGNWA